MTACVSNYIIIQSIDWRHVFLGFSLQLMPNYSPKAAAEAAQARIALLQRLQPHSLAVELQQLQAEARRGTVPLKQKCSSQTSFADGFLYFSRLSELFWSHQLQLRR
jgi:hypothetical protein